MFEDPPNQDHWLSPEQPPWVADDRSLDRPLEYSDRQMSCIYGTDLGIVPVEKQKWNEDAVAFSLEGRAFLVVDGIGSSAENRSRIASQIMVNTFANYFADKKRPPASLQAAVDLAKEEVGKSMGNHSGDVCYTMGSLEKTERGTMLNAIYSGDVRLVVVDKDGLVRNMTMDHRPRGTSPYSVTGTLLHGKRDSHEVLLRPGDRVIIATDGVWDNFDVIDTDITEERYRNDRAGAEAVAQLVRPLPLREAFAALRDRTRQRMRQSESGDKSAKMDNIAIFMFDFNPI